MKWTNTTSTKKKQQKNKTKQNKKQTNKQNKKQNKTKQNKKTKTKKSCGEGDNQKHQCSILGMPPLINI